MYVDANGNSKHDEIDPITLTDSNGYYEINDLHPGQYTINLQKPHGWSQITPAPKSHDVPTITVTVTDGGLDDDLNTPGDNAEFSRQFDVTVKSVVLLVVDDLTDLPDSNAGDGFAVSSSYTTTLRAAIQEANASEGKDVITVPSGRFILSHGDHYHRRS